MAYCVTRKHMAYSRTFSTWHVTTKPRYHCLAVIMKDCNLWGQMGSFHYGLGGDSRPLLVRSLEIRRKWYCRLSCWHRTNLHVTAMTHECTRRPDTHRQTILIYTVDEMRDFHIEIPDEIFRCSSSNELQ